MLIKDQVLTILCHEANILHHDISPNNIMLVHDDDGRVLHVLLIDFDYASMLEMNKDGPDIRDHFLDGGPLPLYFIITDSSS
jgi:serine/threonine protein kinase